MRVRLEERDGALVLRIPRSLATGIALDDGSEVELSLEGRRLIITPVRTPRYRLDDLLDRISPESLHGEVDFGPSIGNET